MSWLVSTDATATTCRCGAPLLVALDEGLAARVDAEALTPAQEIAALIAGKWTYTHARKQLIHRDTARINSNQPPGTIHAEHTCDPNKGRLF